MIGAMEFSRQVGALPVRRGPDGTLLVLLVTTLQTQRWIIPKGWPWPGQQDCASAAAEAREEAGVLGEARAASIGSYTYEKRRPSGRVPVRVTVYLLEVRARSWRPGPSASGGSAPGSRRSEAAEAVQEPELRARCSCCN